MRIGVVFPQTEIEPTAGAILAYARGAEALGYAHLAVYDHVVGADPAVHEGWRGYYDVSHRFHEPFVVLGFLAGTTTLELVPSVVVLPQRQTVLVAKQAAALDVLAEGRLRLGVGVGWNPVEYEALGMDFTNRGRRMVEQIELLRRLWTEESVTFDGEFEHVTGAGLAPLPVQRPIPVWLGAMSQPALRRVGRLADGWFPLMQPGPDLDAALAAVAVGAEQAGRDPAAIAMEARVTWGAGGLDEAVAAVERWREVGASHVSINTMGSGLASGAAHLDVLAQVAAAVVPSVR